jgi:xanthine dehydrogenase accessory factor
MNELQAIVMLASRADKDRPLAMATVVSVQGSTYRRPGARMLVTASGDTAGIISGGCLEGDVRERARNIMATGVAQIMTYDATAPEDIVFGLGLGCNGIVDVLIEPLNVRDRMGLLAFFRACHERQQVGRIATAFRLVRPCVEGPSVDRLAGGTVTVNRVLQWPDGTRTGDIADATLAAAMTQALDRVDDRRAAIHRIDAQNGARYDLLVETIAPPTALVIFGAGDDAIPVAQGAKFLGWHVTVIDARPTYAVSERFPAADAVFCLHPESLHDCPQIAISPASVVMVMTHNYMQDREILRRLLLLQPRYLGVLGPKARTQRLLDELAGEGAGVTSELLTCLHGPAGLDIGAETPEEIAIALLAEMQATLTRHGGGPLRDRNAGIHDSD